VSAWALLTVKFSKKNFTFSSPNFFLAPHTLTQCTCSKLAPFCLCLLYLTISLLYTYFFLYVWYELQVHKIIEQICSKNGIHVHETSLRPYTWNEDQFSCIWFSYHDEDRVVER
jgi:hypothetical protein